MNSNSLLLRVTLLALSLIALSAVCTPTLAQSTSDPSLSVGVDLQRYPVGNIAAVVFRVPLGDRDDVIFGVGYNEADREDNGEFDDESGEGFGTHIAYRRYLDPERKGWSYGGRVDFFRLDIDWIDEEGSAQERRGTTEIGVLQPAGVGAYGWHLGNAWTVELSVALGAEINVRTDGEDVGEGAILLGGVSFLRRF